ncbi:MAG TPA: type II secretion system F family protein [Streptosporangiaceae bacterium]
MNLWALATGVLCGLGIFVAVREIVPAPTRLDAALARLDPGQDWLPSAAPPAPRAGPLARRIAAELPWLPVPATDLALLGKDREGWIASKVACGLLGLVFPPLLAGLAMLAGTNLPWTFSVVASLVFGAALFFAPDLVTRVNAAERRNDFRHALTSYLDLVALERGAGAGPTEALEAAAEIGDGWAFQRISGALAAARRSGAAPWTALAGLARETGVSELADVADIAEVAGHEGAKILETLTARAASMRAQALASDRAKAGARSTTMVVPIALLGAGFLLLLIFPIVYRTFGPG